MNMTRRKFFTGMAIGLPAALVASKLPVAAADLPDTTIADGLFDPDSETIYTSLPTATWRKLSIDRTPLPYWRQK